MMKTILVAAFLSSGSAAAAGQTDVPSTLHRGPGTLQSEMVCVRESRLGSRLDFRKVCRTRAEWREHRRMFRESIERAQNQRQTG